MSKDRYNIFASRENFNALQIRLKAVKRGHDLLEQKADSLTIRLRDYDKIYRAKKVEMVQLFREAMMTVAEARYVNPSFLASVLHGYVTHATITVGTTENQIAGVHVVDFQMKKVEVEHNPFELIGLARGGQKLKAVRESFTKLLELCVCVTSVQKIERDLNHALEATNRRMRALETLIIPRCEHTLRHIREELDELDREAFTRIKLIQKKKYHDRGENDISSSQRESNSTRRRRKCRRFDDECSSSSPLTGSGMNQDSSDEVNVFTDSILRNDILDLLHNSEELDLLI